MPWPIRILTPHAAPAPIRWHRWGLLLAFMLTINALWVLWHEPSMASIYRRDVWPFLFLPPCAAFLLLLGFRLLAWEQESISHEVWTERAQWLAQTWDAWGRRHQVVTGVVVIGPVMVDIAGWCSDPSTRPMHRDRALILDGTAAQGAESWLMQCFTAIAKHLASDVRKLTGALAVNVVLDRTTHDALRATGVDIGEAWRTTMLQQSLRVPTTITVHVDLGLSMWEAWVDTSPDQSLLWIAAQRAADPNAPAFSEGVVALLFHNSDASSASSKNHVRVYRPMTSDVHTLAQDIAHLCRVQGGGAVPDVWHTTLDGPTQGCLRQALQNASLPQSPTTSPRHEHQLDEIVGLPGPLSPWIALGLAIRAAQQCGNPQLSVSTGPDHTVSLCLVAAKDMA